MTPSEHAPMQGGDPRAVTMHEGGPLVACSDGTVWWWCKELGEWSDYDPIPGSAAALAATEAEGASHE